MKVYVNPIRPDGVASPARNYQAATACADFFCPAGVIIPDPLGNPSREAMAFFKVESARRGKLIKQAGIKIEWHGR